MLPASITYTETWLFWHITNLGPNCKIFSFQPVTLSINASQFLREGIARKKGFPFRTLSLTSLTPPLPPHKLLDTSEVLFSPKNHYIIWNIFKCFKKWPKFTLVYTSPNKQTNIVYMLGSGFTPCHISQWKVIVLIINFPFNTQTSPDIYFSRFYDVTLWWNLYTPNKLVYYHMITLYQA